MLGVGFSEIVVIALVCLVAFGPKQLPAVMRRLAGYFRQFMDLKDELRFQILSADDEPHFRPEPKAPEDVGHG